MRLRSIRGLKFAAAAVAMALTSPSSAADIGQIKVAKGAVTIERGAQTQAAAVGARLQASDVVKTGADGSVGINMSDNSLLSLGPNSTLSLDRYEFDSTTNQGHSTHHCRKARLPSSRVASRNNRPTPSSCERQTQCLAFAAPNSS